MRYIYVIRCLIDEKLYIGQTVQRPERRFALHRNQARRGHGHYLHRAMRAHGEEHFELRVIEQCSDEQADDREKYWINEFGTLDSARGYNLESGGNVAKTISDQTRLKQSEAARRRFEQMTTEQREAWKTSLQKRPSCTAEQARKISEYHKGRPKSLEHKRKISAARCRLAEEHFESVTSAYKAGVPVAQLCSLYSVGPSSIYTALRRFGLLAPKQRERRASTSGSDGQPSEGHNPELAISQ